MSGASKDVFPCHACGTPERIELLDAKPDNPENPEGCNWNRLECIACYGPGWACASPDMIKLSVAPKLALHYERFCASLGKTEHAGASD